MSVRKIAFPGTKAGLDGELVAHFGHTPAFTVVSYHENSKEINDVKILNNPPHQSGGCMQPVMLLKNEGVHDVVLGGIGYRPLMGFQQVGINAYRGVNGTIRQNFELYLEKQLEIMAEASCNHHS